ncbi:MAG TPA: transcription antitermination factor NusB [Jiangellaceae bacterium]|nr:transcription antitermination factor NusB [Jiangellaceae bacterium]
MTSRPDPDPARSVAFEVLRSVDERDAYANLVLPGLLRERELTGRDAAFATELAYGTLRGLGTYDAVLADCVDRPLADLDAPVRDALRLGTHQLLATRIPAHAAVATTVDLARTRIGPGPAKLVNAVLRKVSARDLAGWVERLAPADPVDRLALEHAHPPWVARAFLDALGGDLAELADCLAADNVPAAVTLAARPGRCTVDELVAAGAEPARWSPYGAVLAEGGDPGAFPAVRERRAGVQDEGSQLVTLALAQAELTGPDRRWLDLCAGPGGKAALLAGLATGRGAGLLAVEQHPHRARLVERALAGDPGGHRVLVTDARVPLAGAEPFDRVMLDAPCSGLGALRRRPEARWRRQPSDVAALRPLQADLLRSALAAVRPGGLVAYVTCSPHLAETATVVADVLHGRQDVARVDARPFLAPVPDLGEGPDVQLWPHRHGTDAMYLALLRRR